MALFAKNRRFFSPFCFALFVLFVISLLTPAIAGEYHASSGESPSGIATIACAQCHTMHGTQGGASMIYPGTGTGIQAKLLRSSNVLNLCLYCHETGANSAPDIKGTSAQGYIPSAGRFSDQSSDNYANMHDVGLAAPAPPGYVGTWTDVTNKFGSTFNCLYCHDQHGNGNYRNLRYDPGNPVNDTVALGAKVTYIMLGQAACSDTSATPCDVEQTVATGGGLNKYPRNTVTFRRAPLDADNPKRGISAWCGKCHVQFYGISGDISGYMGGTPGGNPGAGDTNVNTPWKRHPVQDISLTLAATNMHADTTNWAVAAASVRHVNPDGVAGNADDQPLCFSCHYAHGGGNPNYLGDASLDHSILAYLDGADKVNIDTTYAADTGFMRNVCQKCHNQ